MNSFLSALGFLTIFPVSLRVAEDQRALAYSWAWFPAAGLLTGAIAGLVFSVAANVVVSSLLVATLAVLASAVMTRGFHYDGFSDTVDAAFGGHTKEDRLRIMKDPHIGVFAVVALVFLILLQIQTTALVPFSKVISVLAVAGMLSRWAVLWPMLWRPYAKKTGLGLLFKKDTRHYMLTTIATGAVAFLLAGFVGLLAGVVVWLVGLAVSLFAEKQFGGITGDVCGSIIMLAELAAVVVMVI